MNETTIDLPVLGMTCAACVRRVERAVVAIAGITHADVNLMASRARIVFDPAVASIGGAATAIRDAGYEVPADVIDALATGRTAAAGAERLAAIERSEAADVRALRRDAAVAIALTAPLLVLAMTIVGTASVVAQLCLGTIVVLGPGARYVRRGWTAVRHGSPDMNTLIALGAGAAWLSSTIVAVRWLAGPRVLVPQIYFEAGAAIVAFVMLGKLLESRARARLSEAVRGLMSLAPARACRLDGTAEHEVDASALVPGDVIVVRPGDRLAADGTVVEGRSAADESMLTGESLPVDKAEGSPIYAGTLNHHGALTVRVARAGADTALARIAAAVEAAQGQKAPIAQLADRVAAWFVPAVLAIAGVTFVVWLAVGAGATIALERMIAVLVIACPCALGLATPAAVAVGTSRGAELGVLFKGGGALELASRIEVVCLDKTGTLTSGHPVVVGELSDEVLRLVGSAEQASEHPIARAIVAGARARGLTLVRPTQVITEAGRGISATVDGHTVHVGIREYIEEQNPDAAGSPSHDGSSSDPGSGGAPQPVAEPGATVSYVAIDGVARGVVAVADPPAPGAREAIAALRAMGIEVVMVTGDRASAARWIADQVGITRIHAEVRPTGKAAIVAAERAAGHLVAMVGDGINDAPALAAADLGIALGSGADVAAAAAEVTLLRDGIRALPTALALSRATLRTIRRNLVAAFAYNALCIPIAAGVLYPVTGWLLSPVLASAAMSLSSVSVLLSSLRLRRFVA